MMMLDLAAAMATLMTMRKTMTTAPTKKKRNCYAEHPVNAKIAAAAAAASSLKEQKKMCTI